MSSQILKHILTLIQENHFEEAAGVISRVAAVQAADPAMLYEVGKLALLMGDLPQAEKHLRASLAIGASNADASFQLGLVLLKEGQFNLAMPAFREACELKPEFALGHFYWGLTLYQMGNLQGALGQFNLASKLDPSLYLTIYYSGLASKGLGQKEQAKQYFDQVISANPDFSPAHNELGVYYFGIGQQSEAIVSLQRACKLAPNFPEAHLNLANIFTESEKYETAEMQYGEALKSSELSAKERAAAYNNLAFLHTQKQDWEGASELLLKAYEIEPSVIVYRMNLGLVFIALHEYDLAVNRFAQILRDNPSDREANFYSGLSLLCLAKYDDALPKLVAAEQTPVGSESAPPAFYRQLLLWLGYAYLASKKYTEARSQFEKITASQVEGSTELDALALDAVGMTYLLQNDQKKAIEFFDKAISLDQNLAMAYLHRASGFESLGNKEMANNDYAQALKIDPDCLKPNKDYIAQLLESAQVEKALTQAIKLQTLRPQDIESKILLAKAFQKKSAYPEAMNIVSEILKEEPKNVAARTILGQIFMSQGDFARADEVFQEACKLDDVEAELYLSWARALAYLGFHELALEKFKEAADMNPYDSDIYESWAQALKSLGRFNDASEVYKLASSYL